MRKILIAAILIGCVACADTGANADRHDVRASGYIYDPNAKPVVIDEGAFIYDPNAPALRGSSFLVRQNP
jgi:hypothetical protein